MARSRSCSRPGLPVGVLADRRATPGADRRRVWPRSTTSAKRPTIAFSRTYDAAAGPTSLHILGGAVLQYRRSSRGRSVTSTRRAAEHPGHLTPSVRRPSSGNADRHRRGLDLGNSPHRRSGEIEATVTMTNVRNCSVRWTTTEDLPTVDSQSVTTARSAAPPRPRRSCAGTSVKINLVHSITGTHNASFTMDKVWLQADPAPARQPAAVPAHADDQRPGSWTRPPATTSSRSW